MIARYTRPELGRLWTDEARMEAWRQVEVAAAEELSVLLGEHGPSADELRGDPRGELHRRRRGRARARHRPRCRGLR